jgi:glycosyltransferase involved in cell wall biosynthesis
MEFEVIIPALDEEETIGDVVRMARGNGARRVVVVDNHSSDDTEAQALAAGAHVVYEGQRGYGRACLTGINEMRINPPEWVLFCDGDGADDPHGLAAIVGAAAENHADLIIGNRANDQSEPGALTIPQRFGNKLACSLIALLYGARFHDLGPLRMIRWSALEQLSMKDENFGWTVEMQVKAAKQDLPFKEVPVRARCRRGGQSKISGTIKGSVMAGSIILKTIFKQVYRHD